MSLAKLLLVAGNGGASFVAVCTSAVLVTGDAEHGQVPGRTAQEQIRQDLMLIQCLVTTLGLRNNRSATSVEQPLQHWQTYVQT